MNDDEVPRKKRRDGSGPDSIPRLLGLAFKYAKEGNEAKAWEHWDTAASRGYRGRERTRRSLEFEIAHFKRDRGLD